MNRLHFLLKIIRQLVQFMFSLFCRIYMFLSSSFFASKKCFPFSKYTNHLHIFYKYILTINYYQLMKIMIIFPRFTHTHGRCTREKKRKQFSLRKTFTKVMTCTQVYSVCAVAVYYRIYILPSSILYCMCNYMRCVLC